MILTLLVATNWDKSMGGKAFHKQGILEKKFLAELLEEIWRINFPCDDERDWLVWNIIKILIIIKTGGSKDFSVKTS